MRMSREARILLALVAVAAAAWVWINYFNQPEEFAAVPASSLAETSLQTEDIAVQNSEPRDMTMAASVDSSPQVATQQTENPFSQIVDQQARGEALQQAATDLETLGPQIEAGEVDETTSAEVERIRIDLAQAFEGAGERDRQTAQDLDTQLGTLTQQLIEGRAEEYQGTYGSAAGSVNLSAQRNREAVGRQLRRNGLQQAATDLETLAPQIEAGEVDESTSAEVERIRVDLSQAFEGAEGADLETAQALNVQLGDLSLQLTEAGPEEYQPSYTTVTSSVATAIETELATRQLRSNTLRQAATDLELLRPQIEAGEVDESTSAEVERIRVDLSQVFEGAGEVEQQTAQDLDTQLGTLTQQLIEGRADEYQDTYGALTDSVDTAVQVDASLNFTPSFQAELGEGSEVEGASPSVASGSAVASGSSVAPTQPLTARELEVAELPFLVTEPPSLDVEIEGGVVGDLDLSRPRGELRATVNPFSPILLAPAAVAPAVQPPVTAAATPAPTPTPTITNVPIPNAPTANVGATVGANVTATAAPAAPQRVVAPRPNLFTPQSTQASALPRPLPGGTLPTTPDVLRTTRSSTVATPPRLGPDNLSAVAAIRVPGSSASVTFDQAAPPVLASSAEVEVTPLQLGGVPDVEVTASANPLQAGTNELSRYLRDNDYRFTGYVIGSVGVGVFRSRMTMVPIVVTLGQQLPDTDIVLTSLKGKQAEFTQASDKQVLTLDLR